MLTSLKSDRISFENTKSEDLDSVLALEQDQYNSQFVFCWSREQHMAAMEDPGSLHLVIKSTHGQFVGYMLLSGVDSPDKCLEFKRLVIGAKGRGYGREAVRLLKKLAFEVLKCHRLWLDVYTDNSPALNLYLSEGFVREGVLRECKRSREAYRSMMVMSMLEQEYWGGSGRHNIPPAYTGGGGGCML